MSLSRFIGIRSETYRTQFQTYKIHPHKLATSVCEQLVRTRRKKEEFTVLPFVVDTRNFA
jgi:hypothetical protein